LKFHFCETNPIDRDHLRRSAAGDGRQYDLVVTLDDATSTICRRIACASGPRCASCRFRFTGLPLQDPLGDQDAGVFMPLLRRLALWCDDLVEIGARWVFGISAYETKGAG
jgi:hypothetical protein